VTADEGFEAIMYKHHMRGANGHKHRKNAMKAVGVIKAVLCP